MYKLGIVVPCYNEEEVIEITTKELLNTINGYWFNRTIYWKNLYGSKR